MSSSFWSRLFQTRFAGEKIFFEILKYMCLHKQSQVFLWEAIQNMFVFCVYCCIFQEQLSIKIPLGDCFWVFFISFCKCYGMYFIKEIFLSMFYLFVFRMNCWTFHHEDYWKQTLFQLFSLILRKLQTNVMQAKSMRSIRGRNRWATSDFFVIGLFLERRNQNPFKHLRWSFLQKTVNGFKLLTIFRKRLHLRSLTGFWIHLCVSFSCEV